MSKALINKNISGAAKDDLSAIYDNVILEIEKSRIDNAFQHKYMLTGEQAAIAAELFEPIIIRQRAGNLIYASHPILNILNDYCDHTAAAYVHHLSTRGLECITIGDSLNRKVKSNHNCLLVDDTREAFRIMGQTQTAASDEITKIIMQDRASHGTPAYGLCCEGSQNCRYQATHMVGLHSMYNVTLDDLYLMFYRHNAYYMINYMYIPYQIYHAALAHLDAKLYNIHHLEVGGQKCYGFSMRDNSIPYIHNRDNWHVWANWTTLRGPTFTLVKEVSTTIGPLQTQVITRVARNFLGEILSTVPLSNWVKRNVLVPDMVYFVEKKCCLKQKELPHIPVPEHVVNGILSYAIRATDGSYQFTDVATLASGLRRELTIGSTQYYESWNVCQDKYNRSLISMFYIGALMRTERTSVLSKTFGILKEKSNAGFFGELSYNFRWYFNRLMLWGEEHFKDRPDYADAEPNKNPIDLDEFQLIYLSDIVINGALSAKVGFDDTIPAGEIDDRATYGVPVNYAKKGKYPKKKVADRVKSCLTKFKYKVGPNQPIERSACLTENCPVCGEPVKVYPKNIGDPITGTCKCGCVVHFNALSSQSDTSDSDSASSHSSRSSRRSITTITPRRPSASSPSVSPHNPAPAPTTFSTSRSPSNSSADIDLTFIRNATRKRVGEFSRISSRSSSRHTSPPQVRPVSPHPRPPVRPPTPPAAAPLAPPRKGKSPTPDEGKTAPQPVFVTDFTRTRTPSPIRPVPTKEVYKLNNCSIELLNGNIAAYTNSNAIINASNNSLQLGSGVSGALRKAFPSLQANMNGIDRKLIKVTACLTTDNGYGLPIIHAIGPDKSQYTSDSLFMNDLRRTYDNIGVECAKYNRIAGCLVSAGVFGGDKRAVADVLVNMLRMSTKPYTYILISTDPADLQAVRDSINSKPYVRKLNSPVSKPLNQSELISDPVTSTFIEERAKPIDLTYKDPALTATQRSFLHSMFCDLMLTKDDILLDDEPEQSTMKTSYKKRQAWEDYGTTDLGMANEIARGQFPTNFRTGHCAMQSVYNSYYALVGDHKKIAIATILRNVRDRIIKMGTEKKYADLYIFKGHWNQSSRGDPFVSSVAIKAMADYLGCNITINLDNGKINKVTSSAEKPVEIDIYYKNNHFSSIAGGGAKDKFPSVITEILSRHPIEECKSKVYVEISAAPGHLAVLVDSMTEFDDFHKFALVYQPGIKFDVNYVNQLNDNAVKRSKDLFDKRTRVVMYNNHDELRQVLDKIHKDHGNIGYLISDAARAVNTEQIIDSLHNNLNHLYKDVECIVYKTFSNPVSTWENLRHYENVDTFVSGVGSEVYYISSKYKEDNFALNDMYDRFHKEVTLHSITHESQDVYLFARNYFIGEFKKYIPNIPKVARFSTTFEALTGYASASKTTKAVRRYGNSRAIFIAPTKTLSLKHQKMGVASYTPHVVFNVDKSNIDTIVIDELSQFDVRYLHLLHIQFPNTKLVVVGDVYQTKGFTGEKIKPVSFSSVGVVNNMWEVYKIPLDIVNILNEKYGYNMIYKGDVERGLYYANERRQDVSDLPIGGFDPKDRPLQFIAMNTATVDELEKRKIKANTVTTYTGSRDHTVVFVVDNRAVASQLVNQREIIYTAMTRATNQLVVYGQERDILKTVFKSDNGLLISLQEANNVRITHENRMKMLENVGVNDMIDKGIAPEIVDDKIVSLPVAKDVAVSILSEQIKTDKPLDVFTVITPSKLPAVEEGVLKLNQDTVADTPKDKYVYKIDDNVILVKHQTSDGKLETVRTIIGRYAKKNKKISPRSTKLLKSDLLDGLAKAIYGKNGKISTLFKRLGHNAHDKSYVHNLQYHYEEYIKTLQQKINSGSAVEKDYTGEFEPFDEFLSFFNKNQDKFDTKFDLNKFGQGVAAFSKKVNLLFSCYARYILQEIRSECNQGDIYIATHDDEKKINSEITKLMVKHKKRFRKFFNCDISEWDSRFLEAFCEVMKELLKSAGLDATWVDWFYEYRKAWKMIYRTKDGSAKLKGHGKQFSGNPFTILENTICNLAFMWTILDIKDFGFALFKGDDSCIYAGQSTFSVKGKRILEMTGHITKENVTDSGEFAGYIITEAGIFPDVVRYAAKFIGKNYRDEDHFLQAQDGLKERVRSVQNQTQLLYGCAAMQEHYPGLTPEHAGVLFEYIKSAQNLKFSQLKKVKVRTHIA